MKTLQLLRTFNTLWWLQWVKSMLSDWNSLQRLVIPSWKERPSSVRGQPNRSRIWGAMCPLTAIISGSARWLGVANEGGGRGIHLAGTQEVQQWSKLRLESPCILSNPIPSSHTFTPQFFYNCYIALQWNTKPFRWACILQIRAAWYCYGKGWLDLKIMSIITKKFNITLLEQKRMVPSLL